jgi:hypothetical protein
MAIALVQTSTEITVSGGTGGSVTVSGVASGNLLVCVLDSTAADDPLLTVSDDKSNSWLQAVTNGISGAISQINYVLSAAAGNTLVSVTADVTTDFVAKVQERSGGTWTLGNTSSIDESATTSHVCSATSGEIDTTGEAVIIANSVCEQSSGTFGALTVGSGYTQISASTDAVMWQYQQFAVSESNNRGAFTSGNSRSTAAVIAAFLCTAPFIPCEGGSGGCWWPCCSEETGTPQCAYVGSVGSESGDECTDCATVRISDDFSGTLDAAWIEPTSGCADNGIGSPGFVTSSGVVTVASAARMVRPFSRPALSGFCIQVSATLTDLPGGGVHGIMLGYGRAFFARVDSGDYGRHTCLTVDGCIEFGSNFANFGPTPADGDVISMIFRDEGGADGICSICYLINGTVVRVEEGVQTCFASTIYAGLMTGATTLSSFDDFEVKTS